MEQIENVRKSIKIMREQLNWYAIQIELTPNKFTPADIAGLLRHTEAVFEVFDKVLEDAQLEEEG
ncbi:MAG TPA: hypothetical protein VHY59_00645 [Chthoniobacterales bacterium]|nr:hypothetical protein [Chthoniobacterales bacterium]